MTFLDTLYFGILLQIMFIQMIIDKSFIYTCNAEKDSVKLDLAMFIFSGTFTFQIWVSIYFFINFFFISRPTDPVFLGLGDQ